MKLIMFHDVFDKKMKYELPYLSNRYNENIDYDSTEIFRNKIQHILNNHGYFLKISDIYYFEKNNIEYDKENAHILTFDDGLLTDLTEVLPILEEFKIHASFFVSGLPLLEKKVLLCHKIQFIMIKHIENLSILTNEIFQKINDQEQIHILWDMYSKSNYKNNTWSSHKVFVTNFFRNESKYQFIVDELFQKHILAEANLSEEEFVNKFYLSRDQILYLKSKEMDIGCHGYYHTHQDDEYFIKKTINILQNDIGIDTIFYSYPHGYIKQYDYLKNLNVKYALTTDSREINSLHMEDNLLLPRIHSKHLQ